MADVAETLVAAGRRYGHHAWLEPNRIKPLFGDEQKWTPSDAMTLLSAAYDLMGY